MQSTTNAFLLEPGESEVTEAFPATLDGTAPGAPAAYDNRYWDHWEAGIYTDAASGDALFASIHKFDSGCGWPSFCQTIAGRNLKDTTECNRSMVRIQVHARTSGAFLGYLFLDGPGRTALTYCIVSSALHFVPAAELKAQGYESYSGLFPPVAEPIHSSKSKLRRS